MLQLSLFGDHQPLDRHGNPLNINDVVRFGNGDYLPAGVITDYQIRLKVEFGNRQYFFMNGSELEKIDA